MKSRRQLQNKPSRHLLGAIAIVAAISLLAPVCYVAIQPFLFPAIPAKTNKTVEAGISISPDQKGHKIPTSFLGFSMETNNICSFLQTRARHPEIDTYLANLQPLVLRVGGSSADHLSWQPSHGCPTWYAESFGTTFIDNFFAYTRKNNIKVIWTVNLGNNQPAAAAQEAAYTYKVGGYSLLGISIGNEPNEYKDRSYAALTSRWKTYYTTIHKALPNIPIFAPDTSGLFDCGNCSRAYFQPFLRDYAADSDVLTTHYYPLSNKTATIQDLLARSTIDQFSKSMQSATAAKQGGLPLVISETNSAYGGGRHGVSDTFAAGLWGLDYLYTAAENNVQGVYFHSSLGTTDLAYSPIGQNIFGVYTTGLYYAMLLFHDTALGGTTIKATTKAPINLITHATIAPDKTLHIAIINKDLTTNAKITVALPDAYRTATGLRLEAAQANTVVKGMTLGGTAISNSGQWQATPEHLTVNARTITLTIPAATAMVITLQHVNALI